MKSIEQILLEKLTVTQPVNFPTFYGNVHHHVHTSLTTGKYPQPHESKPHFHIHIPQDPFQIIVTSTLRFHVWAVSDLQIFQLKMYVDFSSLLHRLHTQSISPSLILSLLKKSTNYSILFKKFPLASYYAM
jgi:hypothetical protein